MEEREVLECDVLIVGGGVGGLSCAIALADEVRRYNIQHPDKKIDDPQILLLEKSAEIGMHALSGCVLDPRGLDEVVPDWKARGAPIKQPVTDEEIAFLTEGGKMPVPDPAIPPYLRNEGHYICSLGEVTAWMADVAREKGVEILEGVPGAEILTYGDKVMGVLCADMGRNKDGEPGEAFMPGAQIHAKVTVFAEGVRGSLTRRLIQRYKLDANKNPQSYATGVKEVWELPEGTFPAGKVLHTLGYPLQGLPGQPGVTDSFGGSFIYGMDATHIAIGLVVGLDYSDPTLDPHNEFNRLKLHPTIKPMLEKGKLVAYGAKAIPEGGLHSIPRHYGEGFVIVGDSASFLNAARLKGAHLAMKTGQLAAQSITQALAKQDFSWKQLGMYEDLFQTSWAHDELYQVRNWRAAFAKGLMPGSVHELAQRLTGGKGFKDPLVTEEDYTHMQLIKDAHPSGRKPEKVKADGKVTFDKITDVYHSGTVHGEDQPCHLVVPNQNLCVQRCTVEYGNPCQHFCPAGVYEWTVPELPDEVGNKFGVSHKGSLTINAGNCVHCKTCDIKDPYENIIWVTPEGGDGPRYQKL